MNSTSLLDKEYTDEGHLKNILLFGSLSERIKNNYTQTDMSVKEYWSKVADLYLFIEKYIEDGIENIVTTLRELIINSYIILINLFSVFDYDSLTDELVRIYREKNWDYNNAAEFQLEWSGAYTFKTTLEHKIMRIKSYYNGKEFKVKDEKIFDTIADLINYCYIYLIWASKGFKKDREIKIDVV